MDVIQREFIYIWYYSSVQFEQIFWYWVTGMIMGSLISVFAKSRIHRLFASMTNKKWGILGVIPASLLDIASPLCMYGTIPIAVSFAAKGMRRDWLASFMMSSMLLNPQLLIYSAALGPTALFVRITTCFLCGITAGILIRIFYRDKDFFSFPGFSQQSNRDTDPNMLYRFLRNLARNVKATGGFFLIGILLSALFQRYVPAEWFAGIFGENRGFGVLMAATIGVPMYVCGGGTIPLLQDWLRSGMSIGSAAAFMITGPATKITNLGALKIILGFKHFVIYLTFTILFAIGSGLVVDMIMQIR